MTLEVLAGPSCDALRIYCASRPYRFYDLPCAGLPLVVYPWGATSHLDPTPRASERGCEAMLTPLERIPKHVFAPFKG